MTGAPLKGAAALPHRAAGAVRCLGVRVVLLAFWGTAALLSRWCEGCAPTVANRFAARRDRSGAPAHSGVGAVRGRAAPSAPPPVPGRTAAELRRGSW